MNLVQVLSRARPKWWAEAACTTPIALKLQQAGRANWFPARGRSAGAARDICADCPVRRECLAEAMAEPFLRGIRGGFTEAERKRKRGAS